MSNYEYNETNTTFAGVPGRLVTASTAEQRQRGLFMHQVFTTEPRPAPSEFRKGALIRAEVRFDDNCGNGHNSFAITADVYRPGARDIDAGGCLHDEIVEAFPELSHLIKWHLCNSDGPMHYVSNALYLAGNRDYNGRGAGEPDRFAHVVRFADSPISHRVKKSLWEHLHDLHDSGRPLIIEEVEHEPTTGYQFAPKFAPEGYTDKWHECPWDDSTEAYEFAEAFNTCVVEFDHVPTHWSEGKERELDAARRAAAWPEATDEQLCLPRDELKALLEERLPILLSDFRADIENAGFSWYSEL